MGGRRELKGEKVRRWREEEGRRDELLWCESHPSLPHKLWPLDWRDGNLLAVLKKI